MQDSNDKGFALYDVNGVVREDLAPDQDLNEIFGDLDGRCCRTGRTERLREERRRSRRPGGARSFRGALDKSNDSVRVYLREMGMVPLLTREGEIELAKRIERGEASVRQSAVTLEAHRSICCLMRSTRSREINFPILDVMQAPDTQLGQEEEEAAGALREQFPTAMKRSTSLQEEPAD